MERNRRTKFRRKEFHCSPCGYGTGKQSNFDRHCYSERHCSIIQEGFYESSPTVSNTTGTNSPSLSPVSEAEDETFIFQQLEQERCSDFDDLSTSDSDTGHLEEEVLDNERPENSSKPASTAWSPFESKLHFLLTVLHSSKTHKVVSQVLLFSLCVNFNDMLVKSIKIIHMVLFMFYKHLRRDVTTQWADTCLKRTSAKTPTV